MFIPVFTFAQDEEKKTHFQVGAGFSFGFFNPSDINDYIADDLDFHNMIVQTGFSGMFLNIGGRFFVGYKTDINLGVETFLEGAIGPKIISVNGGGGMAYLFNRFSPGVKLTYNLQLSKKSSLVFGTGPMFNNMNFKVDGDKIISGASLGSKFEVAYQFNQRHIAPRAFIDVDFAKVKSKVIEMNYSGVQIGVAFSGIW